MSRILVIGSGNPKKALELGEILVGLPWEVRSLADYPRVDEPEEDAETFEGNAIKKACYYAAHFGEACVADDSGLIVDALDGAPGVHSARYAGPACRDADNLAKLLEALKGIPEADRTARFVCCAAFVSPDQRPHVELGVVDGHIIAHPRGAGGFGYDPVFVPEGNRLTFAEMAAVDKHAISHRGRAFEKIRRYLSGQA